MLKFYLLISRLQFDQVPDVLSDSVLGINSSKTSETDRNVNLLLVTFFAIISNSNWNFVCNSMHSKLKFIFMCNNFRFAVGGGVEEVKDCLRLGDEMFGLHSQRSPRFS